MGLIEYKCVGDDRYEETISKPKNLKIQNLSQQSSVSEITCVNGKGRIYSYFITPDIKVSIHDFEGKSISLTSDIHEVCNGVKLNYCLEGKVNVKMSDGRYLFISDGDISYETRIPQSDFQFPCGYYRGVEVFIQESIFDPSNQCDLNEWYIKKIDEQIWKEKRYCFLKVDKRVKDIFRDLFDLPKECGLEYLMLRIRELFLLLNSVSFDFLETHNTFYTVSQVEIAKKACQIFTNDLSIHYGVNEVAKKLGVGTTSLKNYFRGVYGKNISQYIKEERMFRAEKLLLSGYGNVADIAVEVGYKNASKFAEAFKSVMGATPIEYRRKIRCGVIKSY